MLNLLHFVRHINDAHFKSAGQYLELKSYRKWTHRTFFNMSSGQRKGCFVLFGWYPSADKNISLQKHLKKLQSCDRTANEIYKPMPEAFWIPMNKFSLHAISLTFDMQGNGSIDDPGHKVYHSLTPQHFFRSCACILSVYELRVKSML